MTHLATYAKLSEAHRALLAELEAARREVAADRRGDPVVRSLNQACQIMAADYVIRTATGDVLSDVDVRQAMELALEEVG